MAYERPFRNCSDDRLIEDLLASLKEERNASLRVVLLLAEVDQRDLYARLGYSSLFAYCVNELHLSEPETCLRITAARSGRRFPLIFNLLRKGDLHLTAIGKLSKHLTEENHRELLQAALGKSRTQVEELIADRFPQPDVRDTIRALPVRPVPQAKTAVLIPASAPPSMFVPPASPSPKASPPEPRDQVKPLAPERFAIRFTASKKCRDLIERAKALSSHRTPDTDLGELVEAALEAYVEKLEKQKFKTTDRPRAKVRKSKREHIPAQVKRAVYKRDCGRCTFVGKTGHRCEETRFLEYDHIKLLAHGGDSSADNIRLRCRKHNHVTACEALGEAHMELTAAGFRPVPKSPRLEEVPQTAVPMATETRL